MHGECCPTRREPGQGNAGPDSRLPGTGAGFPGKVLVSDIGRISDDGVERLIRRDGKEVGQLDIGLAPGVSDPLAGNVRAVGVYLHAMNHRARAPAGSEFTKAIDRGNQECNVASGRLQHAIVRRANGPFRNETGNRRRREECASFLAENGSVDRVAMGNESHG